MQTLTPIEEKLVDRVLEATGEPNLAIFAVLLTRHIPKLRMEAHDLAGEIDAIQTDTIDIHIELGGED